MAKKSDKTTKLIVSYGTEMIGTRFRVKISKFDNGVNHESFLVAVQDLLDGGFSMKCFLKQDDVSQFLKLLTEATK